MTHDWWTRLYADDQPDAGRTAAADSLDDRFEAAARALDHGRGGLPGRRGPTGPAGPAGSPRRVDDRPPPPGREPSAWPEADPDRLEQLAPDTELDGADYGALTVRTVSVRGDSARLRGRPRHDALLTARFGAGDDALLLLAVAGSDPGASSGQRAARTACHRIAEAVGRSHAGLLDDVRAGRRGALKSGLGRLTGRGLGAPHRPAGDGDRDRAGHLGRPGRDDADRTAERAAWLRCLLLPVDPRCRTRLFFGAGPGGLFRLRDGAWDDIEPEAAAGPVPVTPGGTRPSGPPVVPPFRFRAAVARPGDTLLLCGPGLSEPLRGAPELARELAARWAGDVPGPAAFLTDVQLPVEGHAADRTAAAVWES
ncbi:protein phosphatase 2C domain-containing protein [Streptomyces chumphonensis]|uniref:protein phosphatase 2C domain-containing protein n=1 Tax=Streptomyces chumphonensis TaxID=1214925 RepID=UPI003D7583C9